MKKEYIKTNAIRNPFADKFDNGYKILIHHNSKGGNWDEVVEVTPEEVAAAKKNIGEHRKKMFESDSNIN